MNGTTVTVNDISTSLEITIGGYPTTTIEVNEQSISVLTVGYVAPYFENIRSNHRIGNPVHVDNLQQWLDHIYSSGSVDGFELTDNLDGTIDIASGSFIARAVDDQHTTLFTLEVGASAALPLTDNATNIVFAEYDAVTPTIGVTTDPNEVNLTTKVPLHLVIREGIHLTIYTIGDDSVDANASLRKRFFYTEKFKRADGGAIIYDAGTLHIGCTAGEFWFGLSSFTFSALDTTGTDVFEYYRLINSAWIKSDESIIDNAQFNNISIQGSESLDAAGNNKYTVHWVYLLGATVNPHFAVIYSQASYNNLALAELATVPSNIPPSIEGLGILLGRVIAQEGNPEIVSIQTVFTSTFTASQATSHNDLAGIQGGASGEYYHLTSKEVAAIQEKLTVGVNGRFATIAEALDYIATQPGIQLIATTAIVDCTQYDNFCPTTAGDTSTIKPGDFFYLDNDDPAIDAFQKDTHYYRILYASDKEVSTTMGLYLESCILGSTKNAVAAQIYRFPTYTIKLLEGAHTTTGATMPDGYNIHIIGSGQSTIVEGSGIAIAEYGYIEFTNFTQTQSLTTFDDRTHNAGLSLLDAGFVCVNQHDVWLSGDDATMLGNYSFQSIRVNNIYCKGFRGHQIYCFLNADFMVIENIYYDTVSGMELVEVINHKRRCASSHRKIVRNCYFLRNGDVSAITGGNLRANFEFDTQPVAAGMPKYKMDFIGGSIKDIDMNAQAEDKSVIGFEPYNHASSVGTILRFINSEIVNDNSHNFDVSNSRATPIPAGVLTLEFINTRGLDEAQLTNDFVTEGDNVIIKYKHQNSFVNQIFASFIVINADAANTHIVAPLTGNITLLDAVNLIEGQEINITFEQDTTGGHTINWLGGRWKVHTNPVGAASQKIVFKFQYDGTDFIQINAPVWA